MVLSAVPMSVVPRIGPRAAGTASAGLGRGTAVSGALHPGSRQSQ